MSVTPTWWASARTVMPIAYHKTSQHTTTLTCEYHPARFPVLAATLDAVAHEAPGYDRTTEVEAGLRLILSGMRADSLAADH